MTRVIAQREQAYVADVQSALRNAATAMESYATLYGGNYSGATIADLTGDEGLQVPPGMTLTTETTSTSYCIEATHEDLPSGHPWKTATFDSNVGAPSKLDSCSLF